MLTHTNPIRNFLGNIKALRWAMSAIYSLSWESWLAYVAFIEGIFPQCGPQYIAVFDGTIPLLVRIMWAIPMQQTDKCPNTSTNNSQTTSSTPHTGDTGS